MRYTSAEKLPDFIRYTKRRYQNKRSKHHQYESVIENDIIINEYYAQNTNKGEQYI